MVIEGFNFKKEFPHVQGEDWSSLDAASAWARERGFTVGSMERNRPIGIMLDCEYISKWGGLTHEERSQLDGMIVPKGNMFRDGDAIIYLKKAIKGTSDVKRSN